MGYKQNNMKFDFMETSFVAMDLNHLAQDIAQQKALM
jgi:hypothetical protein